MAFVFLIVGAVLLASAIRNTQGDLFTLVSGDFTGKNNFIYWFLAIMIIGSIGYIPKAKGIATAFLTLVVLVLVLTKGNPDGTGGGFFSQFTRQVGTTTTDPTVTVKPGGTVLDTLKPLQNHVDLSLPTNMFPMTVQ